MSFYLQVLITSSIKILGPYVVILELFYFLGDIFWGLSWTYINSDKINFQSSGYSRCLHQIPTCSLLKPMFTEVYSSHSETYNMGLFEN